MLMGLVSVTTSLLMQPAFYSSGQALYLSLVVVPLISLSLMGVNIENNIMNISTGKNQVNVDAAAVRYVLWCYGSRFLPAVALLVFAHLLHAVGTGTDTSAQQMAAQHQQHWNASATVVYLLAISVSFVFRDCQLWQKHFNNNSLWLKMLAVVVVLQCCAVAIPLALAGTWLIPPFQVWTIWVIGLAAIIAINEGVKRQEIKVEVRYQKRQRLEFGTKLGINSPF